MSVEDVQEEIYVSGKKKCFSRFNEIHEFDKAV